MRIAVINEFSARMKNGHILSALEGFGHEVFNVGLTDGEAKQELTYIHTGFMAGALLNLGAVDFVVGGCGTGQGFLLSAMQYPGVFCGLIREPLDAFLFAQINAGNCVSLALNMGYGWAGEINLKYIFEKLFAKAPGMGYPEARAAVQAESRGVLLGVSRAAHKPFGEILASVDRPILQAAFAHAPFMDLAMRFSTPAFEKAAKELR